MAIEDTLIAEKGWKTIEDYFSSQYQGCEIKNILEGIGIKKEKISFDKVFGPKVERNNGRDELLLWWKSKIDSNSFSAYNVIDKYILELRQHRNGGCEKASKLKYEVVVYELGGSGPNEVSRSSYLNINEAVHLVDVFRADKKQFLSTLGGHYSVKVESIDDIKAGRKTITTINCKVNGVETCLRVKYTV
jgi:hypothetical protein